MREKKSGSQIKTKKQQVCRAGDLVVAEMDAKFGGYGFIPDYLEGAIVSSHYYLYELDKNKITQEYFEILIKTDFIQNQIEAKGSTNYSSIRAWEFLDYEIPLQSIALQNIIAAKYLKHSRFKEDLGIELHTQLKYLSQLRQRILQEAVEGKLTAKWREQYPDLISGNNHASKLLEKIKAEKERLIKEDKINKEKPLPPITDEEKPFVLPEGWVWCRLGIISINIHYGFNASSIPNKQDVRLLRITDIQNNKVDWDSVPGCLYSEKDIKSYLLAENDIVIARTGGTIGKSFLIKNIPVRSLFASYLIRVIPSVNIIPEYLKFFLESPEYWKQLYDAAWGAGQPNVNGTALSHLNVPLPSLS